MAPYVQYLFFLSLLVCFLIETMGRMDEGDKKPTLVTGQKIPMELALWFLNKQKYSRTSPQQIPVCPKSKGQVPPGSYNMAKQVDSGVGVVGWGLLGKKSSPDFEKGESLERQGVF